ncbi:arylsulfatase [Blastomonas sp.]|uniref:arylsulfatase n=1 Tax=Blastomonas sp. TaxID=1909299 RepID=UPI003594685D
MAIAQASVRLMLAVLICALFAAGALVHRANAVQGATRAPIAASSKSKSQSGARTPPNFVVLLADDLAFMDIGALGGEARTPHLDAIARRGQVFTRYYTSPLCSPSRAMLLTGLDNHRTGVATIPETIPPEHRGKPGYGLRLDAGVSTIADRLRQRGYKTYMTGKWHMGSGTGDLPNSHGFDRSFVLDASGADNWEQKSYIPYYQSAPWFEDGKPASLPKQFYSSAFVVDKMVSYLEADSRDKPFFAFIGFQAIHIPVQAPARFTRNYLDTYTEGWEVMRIARWQRAQAMGLIPQGAPLAPPPATNRRWADLDPGEQALFARHMAINAGMIEAMDHHIGRLVAHLKRTGQFNNTVFVFTSDNGPEPSDPMAMSALMGLWTRANGYSVSADNLGERGTYAFIGPEFANAAASPGAKFKFYTSEGGLHVPLLIAGPGVVARVRSGAMTTVSDIAPTMLEMAGGQAGPDTFDGVSLVPLLNGQSESVRAAETPIGFEVSGNAALFKGTHKLVRNLKPYGDGQWRLFDLSIDPGETRDLATAQPARFAELMADYQTYARANGVLEMPDGYDSTLQIGKNTLHKLAKHYWWALFLAAFGMLALVIFGYRRIKQTHVRRSAA